MSSITPPQPPPTWKHSPKDIEELVKKTIDNVKQVLDKVGALDANECTFDSVSNSIELEGSIETDSRL